MDFLANMAELIVEVSELDLDEELTTLIMKAAANLTPMNVGISSLKQFGFKSAVGSFKLTSAILKELGEYFGEKL